MKEVNKLNKAEQLIHYIRWHQVAEAVSLIREGRFDVNFLGKDGRTALSHAASHVDAIPLIKPLLKAGASPEIGHANANLQLSRQLDQQRSILALLQEKQIEILKASASDKTCYSIDSYRDRKDPKVEIRELVEQLQMIVGYIEGIFNTTLMQYCPKETTNEFSHTKYTTKTSSVGHQR